jgi:hypothetical protein
MEVEYVQNQECRTKGGKKKKLSSTSSLMPKSPGFSCQDTWKPLDEESKYVRFWLKLSAAKKLLSELNANEEYPSAFMQ